MVAMPEDAPLTIPVPVIDATLVVLLLHVPPAEVSLSAEVAPAHILAAPTIKDGSGFIVTTAAILQPLVKV